MEEVNSKKQTDSKIRIVTLALVVGIFIGGFSGYFFGYYLFA